MLNFNLGMHSKHKTFSKTKLLISAYYTIITVLLHTVILLIAIK